MLLRLSCEPLRRQNLLPHLTHRLKTIKVFQYMGVSSGSTNERNMMLGELQKQYDKANPSSDI